MCKVHSQGGRLMWVLNSGRSRWWRKERFGTSKGYLQLGSENS